MKKKGIAAVALAATMISPATFSAVSVVAPGVFVASAAETTDVKVDVKVNGLPADAKGSLKIEFTEKGSTDKKFVWDSIANKDKEFKLPTGKVYLVKIVGTPEGYKAEAKETELDVKANSVGCNIEVSVVKNDSAKPGDGEQKPDTAVKRKLEVQHLDETGKAIASGKVEIVEKDKAGSVATIDFSQPNKNVAELEVGKTYLVNFVAKPEGYTVEKDSYEIKIEPNAEGKTENQILVIKSKKNDSAKPEDPTAVQKLLVLQHIDKSTNKEIKSGEVTILEKGMDEAKAQKYDFSKDDNNVKVTNGKTYVIKFTKTANGYTPLSQEQELKVEFPATDGADTYLAKIYSNPLTVNQGGTNNGTANNGTVNDGTTGVSGSSTGLPHTGVVASSIGVASVGAIGSGLGLLRKRK